MRRSDREITDYNAMLCIVSRCRVLRLGIRTDGAPYIVPMQFGFTGTDGRLTLYLHCAHEGRKLALLRRDPHVSFELDRVIGLIEGPDACRYGTAYECVMGEGTAGFVTDPGEKASALSLLMRHQSGRDFSFTETETEKVTVLRVAVHSWTAKRRPLPEA